MTDDEWSDLDERALSSIPLCLADDVLFNVVSEKTATSLWTKFEKMYMSKSLTNRIILKRNLYNLRMKEGTMITDHLNTFNTLMVQLESIEVKFESEDKAVTLLCSFPRSWDHFVTSISLSSSKTIEFDDVVGALLFEETRKRSNSETSTSEAMMVKGHSRERHFSKHNNLCSKLKGKKGKVKCWFCGKSGHLKKDYWKRQQTSKEDSLTEKKEANKTDIGSASISDVDHEHVSDVDREEVPRDNNEEIVEVPETSLRRSTRIKLPPKRYDDYVTSIALTTNDDEPLCYEEAVEGSKNEKWEEAMKDEMMALFKNATWDLVELPKDKKTTGCKWVYKLKRGVDDTKDRYKERLVTKVFSQKAGIDFHEIFS
eukprot:PITA_09679